MDKIRGFEVVEEGKRKTDGDIVLPRRSTKHSAGYDFYLPTDVTVKANSTSGIIPMDVKAYMGENEVLMLFIRSSIGIKKGLTLANDVAVIDSDYYYAENGGNIGLVLRNNTNEDITLNKGERIMQGVFMPYFIADNDNATELRLGGYGSSGK